MNILFSAAECAPFAKAGGLGDVVGSLPKYLRRQGVDARVMMPLYGVINRAAYSIEHAFTFQIIRKQGTADVHVGYTEYDGVPIYFVASWPFFGESTPLYSDWHWDVPRFIFLAEATLGLAYQLSEGPGGIPAWVPDMLHVHDWHTGLAPFLVDYSRGNHPLWANMGTMLTIHNMGYQGEYATQYLADAGIPARTHPDLMFQNKGDNLLGTGIMYSDLVTTVSPRYAVEIQYPRFGEGLEGLTRLRNEQGSVYGVVNGIDMERANPETDKAIFQNFTSKNFVKKRPANKAGLQAQLGLPERPEVPLIGIVSRLTDQKGIDLALPALRQMLIDSDVQLVALGSGETWLEEELWKLQADFAWKVRSMIGYDGTLAQRIYAGTDMFLMPSRYEPCGTSQMFALRYGSLPIVRETGGLADTVENYDNGEGERGTGFMFLWEEPSAVLGTLRWAVDTYRHRPAAFQRMQKRGMEIDFGWGNSAAEYIRLYEHAVARHR